MASSGARLRTTHRRVRSDDPRRHGEPVVAPYQPLKQILKRTLNNATKLNHQLAAEEIAAGHGFQKHVIEQGEFAGLGIRTRKQYQAHIESVLNNPSSVRYTTDGRVFYLQDSTGTVVIRNPNASDGGTAFQPTNWNDYIAQLPTRTEPYL